MLNPIEIYKLLLTAYGKPRWWSDDPFVVMFQSVLVQNTAWNSVEKTCEPVYSKLTPEYIETLSTEELEQLIRPCGFYKAKAKTIKSLVVWFKQYDFKRETVQQNPTYKLREELLSIKGIGAETADVILVYAFYKASFIIDAYTRRFLLRLGYDFSDDMTIKDFFESTLSQGPKLYGRYHWLILEHCISACSKKPKCNTCCFKNYCTQKI